MKSTLRLIAFLAAASGLCTSQVQAQEGRPLSNGNELLDACRGDEGPAQRLACSFYIDGVVGGYMLAVGLHDVSGHICVADETTGGEITNTVMQYLEAHPELRDQSSRVLIAMAVIEAFPCDK